MPRAFVQMFGSGGDFVSSTTGGSRSDTFTRADSNTTINPPSDGGSNYSVSAGATWGISSNQGYLVSGAGQDTAVLDSGAAVASVQVTLATFASDTGLILRWVDINNYIVLVIGGDSNIYKNVAGSFTSLGNTAITWVSGDVAKFSVDSGNVFTVYQNGTLRFTSSADAAGATNTKHGLRSNNVTAARFAALTITSP